MKILLLTYKEFEKQLQWALGNRRVMPFEEVTADTHKINAILLDVDYIKGQEKRFSQILKEIKERYPNVPIIFYTSLEKGEFLNFLSKEIGIIYFSKGNNIDSLLEFLKNLIEKGKEVLK